MVPFHDRREPHRVRLYQMGDYIVKEYSGGRKKVSAMLFYTYCTICRVGGSLGCPRLCTSEESMRGLRMQPAPHMHS